MTDRTPEDENESAGRKRTRRQFLGTMTSYAAPVIIAVAGGGRVAAQTAPPTPGPEPTPAPEPTPPPSGTRPPNKVKRKVKRKVRRAVRKIKRRTDKLRKGKK